MKNKLPSLLGSFMILLSTTQAMNLQQQEEDNHLVIPFHYTLNKDGRLPTVSDKDLAATTGTSNAHSRDVREQFAAMHAQGDTWPDERLEKIFLEGLFQHYFHQFSGFNYEKSYIPCKENTIIHFDTKKRIDLGLFLNSYGIKHPIRQYYTNLEDLSPLTNLLTSLRTIGDALKANPIFKALGGDFQRHKILLEKKEKFLEQRGFIKDKKMDEHHITLTEKTFLQNLLNFDKETNDIQTLLFYWIKDICDSARQKIKAEKIGIINPDHPFITQIKTRYPKYAEEPVYRQFLKNIPEPVISAPLPQNPRSADEIEIAICNSLIESNALSNIKAIPDFSLNDNEEDFDKYTQAFDDLKSNIRKELTIQEEEIPILENVLNKIITDNLLNNLS